MSDVTMIDKAPVKEASDLSGRDYVVKAAIAFEKKIGFHRGDELKGFASQLPDEVIDLMVRGPKHTEEIRFNTAGAALSDLAALVRTGEGTVDFEDNVWMVRTQHDPEDEDNLMVLHIPEVMLDRARFRKNCAIGINPTEDGIVTVLSVRVGGKK